MAAHQNHNRANQSFNIVNDHIGDSCPTSQDTVEIMDSKIKNFIASIFWKEFVRHLFKNIDMYITISIPVDKVKLFKSQHRFSQYILII